METPGFLRDSTPARARQYFCSTLGAKRVARRSLSVRITPTAGVVAGYRRRSCRAGVVELPAQSRGDEKSPSSKFYTPAAQWEKNWNSPLGSPLSKGLKSVWVSCRLQWHLPDSSASGGDGQSLRIWRSGRGKGNDASHCF